MKYRKPLLWSAPIFLALLGIWLCWSAGSGGSETAKYHRWTRTVHLYKRVAWWKQRLPGSVAHPLRLSALSQKYMDEHFRLGRELLASGYLTNLTLATDVSPTNTAQRLAVLNRLRKACQGREGWEVFLQHNDVLTVTCRPQDEAFCRQALQP